MKQALKILLISLLSFGVLVSCNLDNDDNINRASEVSWNLRNIAGGIAGVDEDFDNNEVIWIFREESLTLTVINNASSDSLYSGLESGVYSYEIFEINGELFLFVEGSEFAGLAASDTTLILDQNKTTNGSGADGFILRFSK